ncbi:MAG: hypothetical protein ABIS86_19905, partial [Streptosporangiaceae bacterium]
MDYTALPHGDEAVVQQWLTRCPPELTPALRPETSAGDNFRHAFYALSESLVKASGPADQPTFVEPRLIAATLLAADVSVIRQDVIDQVIPWLDPEIRFTVQAMITQPGHPLRRRFWPVDGRLPEQLRTGLTRRREQVLGAMYALDLGWCRLGGGIPSRPRGFPSTTALLAEIIGPERASATTAAPTPPAPAPVPQPAWQSPAQAPGMPPLPAPGELPPLPWGAQQPAAEPAVGAWGAPGQGQPSQQPYGQPAAAQQHPGFPQTPQQDPFGRQPDSQAPYGQQPAPGQQGFGQPAHQPASPPARQPAHGQPGAGGQPSYGPPGAVGQPGADGQPGYVSAGANQQPGQAGADQGGFGPPGDQAAAAQQQGVPQEQGPRRPPAVQRGPTADELAQQAGKVFGNVFGRARQLGGRLLGGGGEPDPHTTGPLGFDQPDGPRQPPVPQPEVGEPPRTRVAPAHGTRIMSETMVGDFLDFAPVPQQPVGDIAPPPDDDAGSTTRRAGVAFVSGPDDDAGTFLDGLPKSDNAALSAQVTGPVRIDPQATMVDQRAVRDAVNAANPTVRDPGPHRDATNATMLDRDLPQGGRFDSSATMVDRGGAGGFDPGATMMDGGGTPGTGPGAAPPAVSVLLVGGAHTGQRRFARMVALTVGDGTLHGSDAEDLRGLALERLATLFDPPGSVLLLERVDAAMLEAPDPQAFLRTLLAIRARARTPMVATCDPRSYKRLVQDHPELASAFRVFRLPELRADDQRLSLLRVLADERRASLDAGAWEIAAQDLARLRGPGDLTAARLVEAYLDRACQRALGRGGGAGDRLVLTAADFAGIAESIEPALRPAGDADAYLRLLGEMIGLNSVKAAVQRLAAEADAPVNLLLEGPPGCGKATVAGIIGGIFGAVGVLPSGHVITCRPVHLHGRDDLETELRVAGMVQQADGGLLLVQEADQLTPDIVSELFRGLREHRFMLVLAGGSMGRMLDANPDIRATFQQLDFEPLSDRELVQLFQQLAEKKLYLLEEELRIELMTRFARARDGEGFAFGRTVRAMFEETAARQARRLSGVHGADARTVARLTTRDLPESNLERIMGDLHRADP